MACDSALRLLSLNVRGLHCKVKRKSLFNLVREKKYDVVCLQETYVTEKVKEAWKREWGGEMVYNVSGVHSGGLMVLFRKGLSEEEINVVYSSSRILIVKIKLAEKYVMIANIYAPNHLQDRIKFYGDLTDVVKDKANVDDLIVCGDFNCVMNNTADIISGQKHSDSAVRQFVSMVNECDLYDAWRLFNPEEKQYTWSKSRPFIARRIDYIFVSPNIFDKTIECAIQSVAFSDHRGCSVVVKFTDIEKGPGYWKMNNSLLEDINYVNSMNNLIDSYVNTLEEGCDYQLQWELLKLKIKDFTINYSKNKNMERKNNLIKLYGELDDKEAKLSKTPQCSLTLAARDQLKLKIEIIEQHKARAAQVRSRVKWIEDGEKNTKYFLHLEKSRANSKIIDSLTDDNGVTFTNQADILKTQRLYFSNLYKKQTSCNLNKVKNFVSDCSVPTLTEDQRNECEGVVDKNELLFTLKDMKNGSAPGTDGLSVDFLKMFWVHLSDLITASFNAAFSNGTLSSSQRKAVITLIHKGRNLPRTCLKNYRPISLTNCDYKLVAKCIAERIKRSIQDIIHPDQVGFLKGRKVASLLRMIDDVSDQLNVSNEPGLLFAADFSQAFDRISKEYMLDAFRMFGFGKDLIKWISILMTDTVSCVSYCGWLSDFFPVESGIRQGCPLSPLAFVIAIELLAIKIRQSRNIQGITKWFKNDDPLDIALKIALYADDVTLFLKDETDLFHVMTIFRNFSQLSGLVINAKKSEAMWLGSRKNDTQSYFNITFKSKLKILGIYYSSHTPASELEDNWTERIEKIKRIIHRWEKRNLSIFGKSHIIKVYLISQFVYFMQAMSLPEKILTEINRMFYRFLWRKKDCNRRAFEKVKRNVLVQDFEHGGIKMIDIKMMQNSILLQWGSKLCQSKDSDKWLSIPRHIFACFGDALVCFNSNVKSKLFKGIYLIKSIYWQRVLKTWLDLNNNDENNFSIQLIWNNSFITYQKHVLFYSEWLKNGIHYVSDMYRDNRILTLDEVCEKIGHSPDRILQYNVVYSAVSKFLKTVPTNTLNREDTKPFFHGKVLSTISGFRQQIVTNNREIPCAQAFWQRKFNFTLDKSIWSVAYNACSETRLRVLHWKILHNIYPTNILLSKMKVTDNNLCSYCAHDVDYIEHFFYECSAVKPFWKYIENVVLVSFNVKLSITEKEVLFGVTKCKHVSGRIAKKINHILLIAKMSISIYKKTKSFLTLETVFQHSLRYRKV